MGSHSQEPTLLVLSALFTLTLGACTHLNPPMQATPEQAAEREQESPTPNVIQLRTESSPQQCTVTFDDPAALAQIRLFARDSFAWTTGRSSAGELELCDPSRHSDCWTYRQRCTTHDVNVDPVVWGHFHLSFETGGTCLIVDPGDGLGPAFGRRVDGKCIGIPWVFERRVLYSHLSDHWIKIWVRNAITHTPMYFDMESVWVLPNQPIQLWFRKRDGSWWFWPELTAGNIWNLHEWVRDVSEVRINGSRPGPGPYGIGAFGIRD